VIISIFIFEKMAQPLFNAQHQVNYPTLSSFSNEVKEDQYKAAQWLQKVLLHREAAAWNDEQIITLFRTNAQMAQFSC
jgi:hypothetical protein